MYFRDFLCSHPYIPVRIFVSA